MLPDSFLERLKETSDIEQVISSYLPLKRHGRLLKGLCPFHSEKTPSFAVYTDTDPHFYCFGCQKGGDVITFIREIEHVSYMQAVQLLAQRAGLPMPEEVANDGSVRLRARILELNRAAARFFHETLMGPRGGPGREYLIGRGLTKKTVRTFGLGYAPESWDTLLTHLAALGFSDEEMLTAAVVSRAKRGRGGLYDQFRGRVIFPIIDLRGNVVAFGGRTLGEHGPKYLNSADTPVFKKSHLLYAFNLAKATGMERLLLAEGYMDVIALHQAGFVNAVATLGTAITAEQAHLISDHRGFKEVVIAYDSDGAGQRAASKAINHFSQLNISLSVLSMEGAKDPDEYIRRFGAHRFQNLIDAGKNALVFEIDKLKALRDMDSPEGKTAFLNDFCQLMATLSSDLQRDVYVSRIAREMDVNKDRLSDAALSLRGRQLKAAKRREAHNLRAYVQDNATGTPKQLPAGDLRAAAAERGLLALLYLNPDYYEHISSKISDEDFVLDDHAAIYRALCAQLEQRRIPELIRISAYLSTAQMGLLSSLLEIGQDLNHTRTQLDDFMRSIKNRKERKSTDELRGMAPAEIPKYISSRRKN